MKSSLIVLCLLLGGVIYYQAMHYPRANANENAIPSSSRNAEAEQIMPAKARPLRAYSEIIRRPLFSINRRPPAVQSMHIDDSIDIGALENLVLFGVVISGSTRYAIVGDRSDDSTEQIKEGHRYKGWQVGAISPDSIQFVGQDAQYELFISPDAASGRSGLKSTANRPTVPARHEPDEDEEASFVFDLEAEFGDEDFEE